MGSTCISQIQGAAPDYLGKVTLILVPSSDPPDLLHELVSGKGHTWMGQEQAKHLKFFIGQYHALSVRRYGMLVQIDDQAARFQEMLHLLRGPAAQHGLNAGDKLHHAEGLSKVVIRAEIEPLYLVVFRALGSSHYYRDITESDKRGCTAASSFGQIERLCMKGKKKTFETAVHGVFLILGLVTVCCVLLITVYLIISGIPAMHEIGLIEFLFGTTWASTAAEPSYGILPFILTSVYGTAGAIVIGVPIGFMTAVYLAKVAPPKVKFVSLQQLPRRR